MQETRADTPEAAAGPGPGRPAASIPSAPLVSVVVPTFEERENLGLLVPRIAEVLKRAGCTGEIIVVDDDSPDGTAERARELAAEHPVRLLVRKDRRGLATAVIEGFAMAAGEILVVMDADLSHPVEKLPDLIDAVRSDRADIAVGSRYVAGGGSSDWPLHRRIIGRGAGLLARGLTRLSDPTSGFMAVRRSLLEGVELDPVGWKIVLEVVTRTGGRVEEVPIVFADRQHGHSKLTARVWGEFLHHLARLYDFKVPALGELVRFNLVGISGLVVDTAALLLVVESFRFDPRLGAVVAAATAMSWNFFWNRRWTFPGADRLRLAPSYAAFVAVCTAGLGLRVLVMHVLLTGTVLGTGRGYLLANLIGIVVGMAWNFLASRRIAFYRVLPPPEGEPEAPDAPAETRSGDGVAR